MLYNAERNAAISGILLRCDPQLQLLLLLALQQNSLADSHECLVLECECCLLIRSQSTWVEHLPGPVSRSVCFDTSCHGVRQRESQKGAGHQLREVLSQGLMRISDYQRRRILHLIKHFKSAHKQQTSFSGAHSWNGASSPAPGRLSASHAASMPHRSALAPGSPKGVIPVSSASALECIQSLFSSWSACAYWGCLCSCLEVVLGPQDIYLR